MGGNRVNTLVETKFVNNQLFEYFWDFCTAVTIWIQVMNTHTTRTLYTDTLKFLRVSELPKGEKRDPHLLSLRSRIFWEKEQEKDFINRVVFYMYIQHMAYSS